MRLTHRFSRLIPSIASACFATVCALALAGCGIKGGLYLPKPLPPAAATPATAPDNSKAGSTSTATTVPTAASVQPAPLTAQSAPKSQP
ncbi:LPS translocon maturation chaperone LptM [Uliginosibacterium silvisoli]|uniref:LPS translocon maturation chaperone LptM n=1 Tax=Uliginosibacterium silvisoli TaxID=3114758 RepID=UPI003A7F5712